MLQDLTSKRVIVTKGGLFFLTMLLSAALLLLDAPEPRTALLIGILVWASARFYYFLFYVLHSYVDPSLKYAGIAALVRQLLRRRAPPG